MIQLVKNVKVFRDGAWKNSEILIANHKIEMIADTIDCHFDHMTVVDGEGMTAIPGYIDQHVHLCGGGGEGKGLGREGYCHSFGEGRGTSCGNGNGIPLQDKRTN